jgi:hypothetical protein
MDNLTAVLKQLQRERTFLTSQLESLNKALSALGTTVRRSTMSAGGRARIAAAQRARWAKAKGQKIVTITSGRRRKLSASALSNIRAAQKARWAKWRKAKKR